MSHFEVSLVVPTFGAAAYLPDFVRSLQAQTLENFEVVFVTSTADTQSAAALAPLADQDARLRLVSGPERRGGDVAWAHGLGAAQGAFVAFASPQDLLLSTSLEARLAACKQHAAVVRGCVEHVRPDGTREQVETPQKAQGKSHGGDPGLTLNDFLQAPWGWMLPTGLLRRNNPFTYAPGVDPLALVTRCMWLPDVVYSRVRRPASRQVRSRVREQAQALLQVTLAAERSVRGAFAGALAELPALQADTQAANGDAGLVEALGAAVLGGVRRFKGGDNTLAEFGRQLAALKARAAAQGGGEKLEVAIFPYKSCVFDSVESIWRAAAADPDCEVHLVPIPYFERLPDGTFTRMCYEGADFPPDVPVEDWRDYDVKARHPDVIIIHNPWDDTNGLTSAHPTFYARRLKDLTDLLVYVPYFVTVDGNLGPFYACHPGALHAARVVVQSEDVRQQYIAYFKEFEEKYQCKGQFGVPEEKFVALGSPKYDKLVIAETTQHALPEDWQRKLTRPDGSRKRAVFYNTSVVAIGPRKEHYTRKIRETIEFFDAQDDVVLWWRPHPLAIPEMRRCHPDLAGEYEALVKAYKRSGKGIYDDTPEPYLALTETQGYFGDMSSLVDMYRHQGQRPILIQSVRFRGKTPNMLAFIDVFPGEGRDGSPGVWGVSGVYNALLFADKAGERLEVAARFPGEEDAWALFRACVRVGSVWYFAPSGAGAVGVYDTATGLVSRLDIGEPPCEGGVPYDARAKFHSIYAHAGQLFLVGAAWPGIMRLDPQTGERYCYTEMVSAAGIRWREARQVNATTLCAPGCHDNRLLFFDMGTGAWEACPVGAADNRYFDVCFDGGDYWLTHVGKPVVTRWNRRTDVAVDINVSGYVQVLPEHAARLRRAGTACAPFAKILYSHGTVWVFPYHSCQPVKIAGGGAVVAATELQQVCREVFAGESGTVAMETVTQARAYGESIYLVLDYRYACVFTPSTGEMHLYSPAGRQLVERAPVSLDDVRAAGVSGETALRRLSWLTAAVGQVPLRAGAGGSGAETGTVGAKIHNYYKQILADHQGAP